MIYELILFLFFREYPCDLIAMLNVTLLHTGCPRAAIHETAVQLFHILYKRFFMDSAIVLPTDDIAGGDHGNDMLLEEDEEEDGVGKEARDRALLQEMLIAGPDCRKQLFISQTLAHLHPDLTMPMFSGMYHGIMDEERKM